MKLLQMVPFEVEQAKGCHPSEGIRMDEFNVVVVQVEPYKARESRQSVTRDDFDFIVAYFQNLEEIYMLIVLLL